LPGAQAIHCHNLTQFAAGNRIGGLTLPLAIMCAKSSFYLVYGWTSGSAPTAKS
jgi:hypothetical protein